MQSTKIRTLLAAVVLFQIVACTGNIVSPTPSPSPGSSPPSLVASDNPCPTGIPDQDTSKCPRLKNITLSCGGNGMLHTTVTGGSGSPFVIGATLDDGSVLSFVLVVFNCQDGPRESITLGVTYSGQVAMSPTAPPCISQSKADYSQFQFGDPHFSTFESYAKDQMHRTLDDESIKRFAQRLGLTVPATSRCSFWRQMP